MKKEIDTLRAVKTLEILSARILSIESTAKDDTTRVAVTLGAAKALCKLLDDFPKEWPGGSTLKTHLFDLRSKIDKVCFEIQSVDATKDID